MQSDERLARYIETIRESWIKFCASRRQSMEDLHLRSIDKAVAGITEMFGHDIAMTKHDDVIRAIS